jgi:hypothetical protein
MEKEQKVKTPLELHQHQTWLEIWLPLFIGLAVCVSILVLVILAAVKGSGDIAQLSAISIILMVIPSLFILLASTAIIIFVDYWIIKGNHVLPGYAAIVQQKTTVITTKIQEILFSISSIFINIHAGLDTIKHFFSRSKKNKA